MHATHSGKRSGYLSWDDYFMAVAMLSAQRSKDPNTQVGACIVNAQKRIVGVGYNGFPTGCSDDTLPWCREGDFLDTKYPYVCHAELNAILNSVPGNLDRLRHLYGPFSL
jgi:dCMP deaminase